MRASMHIAGVLSTYICKFTSPRQFFLMQPIYSGYTILLSLMAPMMTCSSRVPSCNHRTTDDSCFLIAGEPLLLVAWADHWAELYTS